MATRGANLDADGNLISWDLSCGPITALTECIGGCTALEGLYLVGCKSLESLGDGISGCIALKELDCRYCVKLTSLGDAKSACWTALMSAV